MGIEIGEWRHKVNKAAPFTVRFGHGCRARIAAMFTL
jgi:hypothetical protein